MNLVVPPSFFVTPNWQPVSPELRHWLRPLWNALASTPCSKRIACKIGEHAAEIWRTRGRGASNRNTFLHVSGRGVHLLVNYSTLEIRTA